MKRHSIISLRALITSITLMISASAIAQDKSVNRISQEWGQYYATIKVAKKWTWTADAGYRYNELFKNPSQYIVRTGLYYQLNDRMKVGSGFAHLGFYTSGKISKLEYRTYEEFALSDNYNHVSIQHRFRIEERYFKSVVDGKVGPGHTFNFRFRYQFLMNFKIVGLSSTNPQEALSLNLGDEIFVNAGREIVYNVFDQNRIIAGPVVSFTKNFSVGLIYNSQFAATTTPKSYVHTDVFWLTVKQNFDISRHKK
jgi:hypothetical protein